MVVAVKLVDSVSVTTEGITGIFSDIGDVLIDMLDLMADVLTVFLKPLSSCLKVSNVVKGSMYSFNGVRHDYCWGLSVQRGVVAPYMLTARYL